MSRAVDLLVLGGGPAGSALAALAADDGLSCVLVEAARFPRDKVCGEFVSAEGVTVLRQLGVLDDLVAAGAPAIRRCRLTDRRGRGLDVDLPRPDPDAAAALGISRARMDLRLLERAAAAGVDVRQPCRALEPLVEDGRVVGARLRSARGARDPLRATLVAGCDGRRSALGRALHPELGDPTRSDRRSWIGLKAHFEARDAAIDDRVDLHLFEGGYAGMSAVEGGRLNLCLLTRAGALLACGKSPDRLLAERLRANPALDAALGGSTRCAPWRSIGPLRFGTRRAAARGALFVGDAAGTIDPFSGEGMSNALLGATLAAPVALGAAEVGRLTDEAAEAYARAWSERFAPVTRRVRRLGRLLGSRAAGPALRLLAGFGRSVAPRLVDFTRTGLDR